MPSVTPNQSNEARPMKKPRGMASKAKTRDRIDMARRWYVQANIPAEGDRTEVKQPSLDAVAQATGLPLVTIHRRSRAEGWVDQRETFASLALEVENKRLVRSMADQHVRSRVAYFRSSMRIQTTVERKLTQEGDVLDMVELSAAGSALAKAQKVTDNAFLGPSGARKDMEVAAPRLTGWPAVIAGITPELQARLVKIEEEEDALGPTTPPCGSYTPSWWP